MVYTKRNNDIDCNVSTFFNLVKQTENIEKRIAKKGINITITLQNGNHYC